MPKRTQEHEPYTDNYPPLQAWLNEHQARCAWQLPLGDKRQPSAFVEMHLFPKGVTAIVIVHANKRGWDLYTTLGSNDVAKTLADADTRLQFAAQPSINATTTDRTPQLTVREHLNYTALRIAQAEGWRITDDHDFSRATDPRSRQFWGVAVAAYEAITGNAPDLTVDAPQLDDDQDD